MARSVVFHECGREFTWNVPEQRVYNAAGMIVANNCYNLPQARTAVQMFFAEIGRSKIVYEPISQPINDQLPLFR